MHILDNEFDNPIAELTLYLTLSEAQELRDSLTAILRDHPKGQPAFVTLHTRREITSAPRSRSPR